MLQSFLRATTVNPEIEQSQPEKAFVEQRKPIKLEEYSSSISKNICLIKHKKSINAPGYNIGTGFFLTSNIMVTAGHCIYSRADEGHEAFYYDIDQYKICPGLHGEIPDYNEYRVLGYKVHPNYISEKMHFERYDYGVIYVEPKGHNKLPDTPFRLCTDFTLFTDHLFKIVGYPYDLNSQEHQNIYEQFEEEGPIEDIRSGRLCYRISTSKGQSGSPVFIVKDGLAYVVGIHNGTVSGNNHHRHNFESNRAVYITHEVIKFIIECEEKMIKKPSNIIEANVAKRMVGGQKSIEKYQEEIDELTNEYKYFEVDSPNYKQYLQKLSMLLYQKGELNQSLTVLSQCASFYKNQLQNSLEYIIILKDLSGIHLKLNQHEYALEACSKALELLKTHPKWDHRSSHLQLQAELLHNLGIANYKDLETAMKYFREAESIKTFLFGTDSLTTSITRLYIARHLSLTSITYEEATRLLEKTLSLFESNFPTDNEVIALTLYYLGKTYYNMKWWKLAQLTLTRFVTICQTGCIPYPDIKIFSKKKILAQQIRMHIFELRSLQLFEQA